MTVLKQTLGKTKTPPSLHKRRRRLLRGTTLLAAPSRDAAPHGPPSRARRSNARHTSSLTRLSAGGSKGIFAAVPGRLAPNGGSLRGVGIGYSSLSTPELFNYPYHTTFQRFVNRISRKFPALFRRSGRLCPAERTVKAASIPAPPGFMSVYWAFFKFSISLEWRFTTASRTSSRSSVSSRASAGSIFS